MDEIKLNIPETWPAGLAEERFIVWPTVNLVVGVRLTPIGDHQTEPDFIAACAVLMPRVPCAGERVPVLHGYVLVDHIDWSLDGRVSARLTDIAAPEHELDTLRSSGWTVFPRRDADEFLGITPT